MQYNLLKKIKQLLGQEYGILEAGTRVHKPPTNEVDVYLNAILGRAYQNLNSFWILLKKKNFMTAAAIARMQLDTLMRLHALNLAKDKKDFIYHVLDGKPLSKYKDRDGYTMHDGYLKEKVTEFFPQAKSVYDATSGYIHFGVKHIFESNIVKNEDESYLSLQKTDMMVTNYNRWEAMVAMKTTTKLIVTVVNQWMDMKDSQLGDLKKNNSPA